MESDENRAAPAATANEGIAQLQRPVWRRALILVLVTAVVALSAASDTLHAALIQVVDVAGKVIAAHPTAGLAVFVGLAAASAMLAFVSAALIVPVAIHSWGVSSSLAMLWLGWILGGACAYAIGRWAGRPVLRWLTKGALDRLEARIRPDAPFVTALLFQLVLPSEIPGYVLGLVRYRFWKYMLALALAELPFAATTVYVGAGLLQQRTAMILSWGLALGLLGAGALYVLRRRLGRPASVT